MFGARFIPVLVTLASLGLGAPISRETTAEGPGHELLPLLTVDGQSYFVVTTFAQQDFELQIDTGGSDTWLVGSPGGTDQIASITIDRDSVSGEIFSADVGIGGTLIQDQFHVQVTQNESRSPLPGVLGLGLSGRSQIFETFDQSEGPAGLSFIENFSRFETAAPFMSILMARSNASESSLGFGAVLPDLQNITNQTRLESLDSLWRVHLDELGIDVNGRSVDLPESLFDGGSPNELRATFDSGFPYSFIRSDVASAIYSLIPTASLDDVSQAWRLPCDAEVNITMRFAGVNFTIHPLDAVMDANLNDTSCLGSFQPFQSGVDYTGDIVLGTNFMHNAYILYSTSGFSAEDPDVPYIQLLPTTDPAKAHAEFLAARQPVQPQAENAATGPSSVDFQKEDQKLHPNHGTRTGTPSSALAATMVVLVGMFSLL